MRRVWTSGKRIMFVTDENNKNCEITSIDEPMNVDYFWVLNLQQQDWKLNKLLILEEFYSPVLTINIENSIIKIPAGWNMLIYSPDTSVVDMIPASDLIKTDYSLFIYNYIHSRVITRPYKVIDYSISDAVRCPVLNKSDMLCHPINNGHWIMTAPTDTYNKFLKSVVTVGDFLY